MRKTVLFAILFFLSLRVLLGPSSAQSPESGNEEVKQRAEESYAEGSYRRAHQLYLELDELELPVEEARWVDFRVEDTRWRAQAATQTSDTTEFDRARRQLEALIEQVRSPELRDSIWAEAHQSLGDFWWLRSDLRNWSSAWTHYQQALQWWAGSRDLETARRRYLEIIWTASEPAWRDGYYYYGYYGNQLPVQVLENVLKIARAEPDRTRAHYLMAMTLRNQGDWRQKQRVAEEFEAALQAGVGSDWHDDALFHYAQWMANSGPVSLGENQQWVQQPDYLRAVQLFRRLLREYSKGETRHWDPTQQQIREITSTRIALSVSNVFFPDSEIQFHLNWRNLEQIDFTLHQVDLTRDVRLQSSGGAWLEAISPRPGTRLRSWSRDTGDQGEHKPGNEMVRIEDKLPVGAYLLTASGNEATARELILVSDASLVLKTQSRQVLVYYCDALDGSPIGDATVHLWQYSYDNDRWQRWVLPTNQEGIAVFDLKELSNGRNLFAFAASSNRQAFSNGYTPYDSSKQPWRILAFTDRPAYRPGEEAHWKILARREQDSRLLTPSDQIVEFEITDPRGTSVKKSEVRLNAFGSAWGSLQLTKDMPLGEYTIHFWDHQRQNSIGSARLLRLEEYRLPEFKVRVEMTQENDKRKVYRLGDKVEASLQVDYYFGAPVADAEVELVIYQRPFYHYWRPERAFPWLYERPSRGWQHGGGRGQVIRQEKIKTDIHGRALFSFDTPVNAGQDQEYEIEARVRDSSRREVIGTGSVKVTRQPYFVYLHPEHNLYRPQDTVEVAIKALDANQQPVQSRGTVKVHRSHWVEIWLDPEGREVSGENLSRLRRELPLFPPPAGASGRSWQLKFNGYQHQEILTRTVRTDEQGEAELRFASPEEGYYRISWSSGRQPGRPITAEVSVWVANNRTTDLGYRHGGLQMVLDKDTFRVGQQVPLMLATPTSDRYVLFTLEAENLHSYRLVHVNGTAKLIQVSIDERHVPNLFLGALMVSDGQIFMDSKEVVVPPEEYFLKVQVETDRQEYQPRQTGQITVTTTDSQGNPISSEVSIGVVDESVYAIQQEYAADLRQFFLGRKHQLLVRTSSSFQYRSYMRLVKGPRDALIDERNLVGRKEVGSLRGAGGFAADNAARAPAAVQARFAAKSSARQDVAELRESESVFAEADPASQGGGAADVQVRSDFRATAFWRSHLRTGQDGKAVVSMKFPDSLTSWRTTVRAAGRDSFFGQGTSTVRTNQPLVVRLQAPRFFVVGDRVTLSAVVNNNTDQPWEAQASLQADGLTVLGLMQEGVLDSSAQAVVRVEAGGQKRLNWIGSVEKAGPAHIQVTARTDQYGDAMKKSYQVYEHGVEKFISRAGKMRSDDVTVSLDLPAQRKAGTTQLTVQLTPSLAVTMLDALPYLIDYPYGCTEQTMSRFLPAAITARTLQDLGLERNSILGRTFGGIVQEHASATHPKGTRNLMELDQMVQQGLERLYDFQHSDGGWGWWKEGESDHFMTAYVVWGLTLAREAGISFRGNVIERAASYLDREIVEAENIYDLQAWMLHALAISHESLGHSAPSRFQAAALDNLWNHRDRLNAYTRALLALSAHYYGASQRATVLVRNLENGVQIDRSPESSVLISESTPPGEHTLSTAHWGEDGFYWRWSEGGVEATAFALKAILAIDPENALVEPVTNWLIKNRRGAQWSNTRSTAMVVLALNDYLGSSQELSADVEYELMVNGHQVGTGKVTPEDMLEAPSLFTVEPRWIREGRNQIRIKKVAGQSPLYFAVQAQFFSLEEPVSPAGNEIFVQRRYYKQVPRETLLNGYLYENQPLEDGGQANSGDRIEVVMTIQAKNNYEYLVFEDLKPAGLESVVLKSGGPLFIRELKASAVSDGSGPVGEDGYTGRQRWVYRELRDRKVALFIDKLPEGLWEIRYQLRAEVPGKFHALPVVGHAMYVPEIRCNGRELRIEVRDTD